MKRWRLWLVGLAAIPLAVWGCDRLQTIHWVGHTDLEIEFVVTEAATGQPVEGAKIAVVSEGGFYREREEKELTLVTGQDGIASRVCHDSMCFGTQSGLRFKDTFVVHLPWWHYRVTADGFEPSELAYLVVLEYIRQVKRIGPGAAKLIVPVSIQKGRG